MELFSQMSMVTVIKHTQMHDPSVDQFFIKTIKDGMVIWGENTS
jgi:hypothetical protein